MAHPIARPARPILHALLFIALLAPAARAAEVDADDLLSATIDRWIEVLEPPAGQPARTFAARATLVKAAGLDAKAIGSTVDLAYQAPDLARASAHVLGETYALGRDGQQIWVHEPGKKFALLAKAGVQRFKADPASVDDTVLAPFALPISRLKIRLAKLAVKAELEPAERIDGVDCHALRLGILPAAEELLGIRGGTARVWLRKADLAPLRLAYADAGGRIDVRVDLSDVSLSDPFPAERWKLKANADDRVETVALSHMTKFVALAPKMLNQRIPTLGPATGKRKVIDTEGKGRLEEIDGTRVLFLEGTPAEMGRQHGTLLKSEIQDVSNKILYGVGVGSSFATGKWFFGEIEGATARLLPHMDGRYLAETDALSRAAGMHQQEGRLSNFFPELFHCSGFAISGKATGDGHLYHGRVLDYMKGVGLEQNAVVVVQKPDDGRHAWVNLTYAGFVGSVTAMNEKGIAIGEMGGKGYGDWDGKPMAHLVREVMERAGTLDEAIAIMRAGPRTCAYYYVISDGKAKTAVGIAATPTTFETVKPGEAHPQLRHAIEDAVLLSAGERYETLASRVKAGHGKFDAASARELMTRPVCMGSNIQSVLFRPDTLDLWVANADGSNVASHTRYTQYNLAELLKPPPPQEKSWFGF